MVGVHLQLTNDTCPWIPPLQICAVNSRVYKGRAGDLNMKPTITFVLACHECLHAATMHFRMEMLIPHILPKHIRFTFANEFDGLILFHFDEFEI